MYGKTFGQIGFGMIGKEVAKRAHALDIDLLSTNHMVCGADGLSRH